MAPNISGENAPSTPIHTEPIHATIRPKEQVEIKENPKKSYVNEVGKYSSTIPSMIFLIFTLIGGITIFKDTEPDKRTTDNLFMSSPINLFVISTLYVFGCNVWGPRLMKNREAYSLKNVIIVYNFAQVLLSGYMFYELGMGGWFFKYNYFCQECDHSNDPTAVRMANSCYIFFLSKLLDYMDTIFFVLRKKFNQISLLHIVHHSSMVVSMWFGAKYTPGGHATFLAFINSFIHTVMYTYYFLSAFGPAIRPYLWWKKYLTTMQLIQFTLIILHTIQVLFQPNCKAVNNGFVFWTITNASVFFILFMNFYFKSYKKKEPKFLTKLSEVPVSTPTDNLDITLEKCVTNTIANGIIKRSKRVT